MLLINEKQVDGAIFVIDGTLVDSFSAFASAFNTGIGKFQLEPASSEVIIRLLKKSLNLHEIFRQIFPMHIEDELVERCQREIWQHFLSIEAKEVRPYPGVERLLENLYQRDVKIGIATGRTSLPEREWDRFKRYGVEGFISCIVTSRQLARKPAPDAILECAKGLRVPIANCLVVGDTEADVIAGRRAGGIPVAIATGEDTRDHTAYGNADFIFENLVEFDRFLQAHPSSLRT
jgi:HAD superfamily hydrolase (TIGR01509 family)